MPLLESGFGVKEGWHFSKSLAKYVSVTHFFVDLNIAVKKFTPYIVD